MNEFLINLILHAQSQSPKYLWAIIQNDQESDSMKKRKVINCSNQIQCTYWRDLLHNLLIYFLLLFFLNKQRSCVEKKVIEYNGFWLDFSEMPKKKKSARFWVYSVYCSNCSPDLRFVTLFSEYSSSQITKLGLYNNFSHATMLLWFAATPVGILDF